MTTFRLLATVTSLSMLSFVWPLPSVAAEYLHHQDWQKVASAVSVLQIPSLQRVVDNYESGKDMIIMIRYPGGDEGNEWAIELRDWLVSFGIGMEDIELQPGSGMPGAIAIDAESRVAN